MNTRTPAAIEPQATPLPAPKPKLTLSKVPALPKDGPALMKSFDKDHPLYKLAALLLVRAPWILIAWNLSPSLLGKIW